MVAIFRSNFVLFGILKISLTINNINGRIIELIQEKTENYYNPSIVVIPIHKDLQKMNTYNIMSPGATKRSKERLQ